MNASLKPVPVKVPLPMLIALCGPLGGCVFVDVIAEALRPIAEMCAQSTFTVVTTARDDSNTDYCDGRNQCTLRRALRTANFCSYDGVKTVRFDLDPGDDTFLLHVAPPDDPLVSREHRSTVGDVGLPRITGRVIIEGGGITIQRATDAPRFRLLHVVPDASLTLNGITLRNGRVSDADAPFPDGPRQSTYGGAVYNAGTTVINSVEIRGNEARVGAGIYNEGTLTVTDSRLSNNNAGRGAAIFNASGATTTILRSRVTENRNAWGALGTEGIQHIEQSTVDNNVGVYAGGLWIGSQPDAPASTTIVNSTLSRNSGQTGAIWCEDPGGAPGGVVELRDVTVAFNKAADAGWEGWETVGGIQVHCRNFRVFNTIVAANEPLDCATRDRPFVGATSLDFDGDCNGFTLHADPQLGSLFGNGGPTPTHLPASDSPVVDAGSACSALDQRGEARSDGSCDIGAVEIR